jgi:hypothetical protein
VEDLAGQDLSHASTGNQEATAPPPVPPDA